MKQVLAFFIVIFLSCGVNAQSIIINPDGTHSTIIGNGKTKTVVTTVTHNDTTKTIVTTVTDN